MSGATWTYADWIQLDDKSARLTRLRLHITEVSQHIMGFSARGQSVTAASERYLAGLKVDEQQLDRTVNGRNLARNKVEVNNR